ncbi:uncharacterized protein LOC6557274 isoform X2 [Drosophila grimshawi]|uniref:GH15564 n=1 Tax=Drosophila grimshawi TaxID=7222 RepID=B4J1C7_DROGR|nr:uncharacterized protein LOC6557274 isoform X2 [Drosophila grimshawi]EDV95818.1 GH15564 [Drosophila grimshawi]
MCDPEEKISDVSLSPAESSRIVNIKAAVVEELPLFIYTYEDGAPSLRIVCTECDECDDMRRRTTKMAMCRKTKRNKRMSCPSAHRKRRCSKPKKRCSRPRRKACPKRRTRAKPC